MDTIVMKFGGSSVSDNDKLKIVANKIIDLYDKGNNINYISYDDDMIFKLSMLQLYITLLRCRGLV